MKILFLVRAKKSIRDDVNRRNEERAKTGQQTKAD